LIQCGQSRSCRLPSWKVPMWRQFLLHIITG
jgi:hypothetical protein